MYSHTSFLWNAILEMIKVQWMCQGCAGKLWYEANLKMKFQAGNCIWKIGGMMVHYFL